MGSRAHESDKAQGERFRTLAECLLPRLYGLARRLVGDDAEDAVQETLLRAYRGFSQLASIDAARDWLTSILVNCCDVPWRAQRLSRSS